MRDSVVLLSIPGLREKDVAVMKNLRSAVMGGEIADLAPSFPAVTCPVQAAMTTGQSARDHGVVANGFYWREKQAVEMWTSPQRLHRAVADLESTWPAGRGANVSRLVSPPWQALPGRLRLHARTDSQPGRQRVTLVLHTAGRILRNAPGRTRPFPFAELLGTHGGNRGQ